MTEGADLEEEDDFFFLSFSEEDVISTTLNADSMSSGRVFANKAGRQHGEEEAREGYCQSIYLKIVVKQLIAKGRAPTKRQSPLPQNVQSLSSILVHDSNNLKA